MTWQDWDPVDRIARMRQILAERPVKFGINILELPDQPIPLYVVELEEHLRWCISRDGLMQTLNEKLGENYHLHQKLDVAYKLIAAMQEGATSDGKLIVELKAKLEKPES